MTMASNLGGYGHCSVSLVRGLIAFIGFMAVTMLTIARVNAATWNVGNDVSGWGVPATSNNLNYTQWAATRDIRFDDELVFKYPTQHDHNVILVDEASYSTCSILDPIEMWSSGDDTITLNRTGFRDYYFTCGEPSDCRLGQKVHITLVGDVPLAPPVNTPPNSQPPSSSKAFKFNCNLAAARTLIISSLAVTLLLTTRVL